MKVLKVLLLAVVLFIPPLHLDASGNAAIYALVSKVVLEPNDRAPERIQIWGAFTLVNAHGSMYGDTLTPQRGYLYFDLPGDERERMASLKEWTDFKAVAGTGQVVAFGEIVFMGNFGDELISRQLTDDTKAPFLTPYQSDGHYLARNILRTESMKPANPDAYPLGIGLTKLPSSGNLAPIVEKLKAALKR